MHKKKKEKTFSPHNKHHKVNPEQKEQNKKKKKVLSRTPLHALPTWAVQSTARNHI
jgi:hypothetical protein